MLFYNFMLDIEFIRGNKEFVKNNLSKRGEKYNLKIVDELIVFDKEWRELKGKIDDLLDKVILSHFSKLAGVKVSASGLIGETIHWFLTAIVLIAVLNLAHLSSVVDFLRQVIGYIPHAIIAALIVAVGSVVANFAAYAAKFITKSENWLTTVRLAINLFALVAALGHLITPLAASINHFLGQLSLSGTQGNALFICVLVIILLASKNVITKAVEKLY